MARQTPAQWLFGADALLLGPGADPSLAAQRKGERAEQWAAVFPGLAMPEGIV
jgi:hypothetical protein